MVRKDNQNSLRGLKSARAELKNHHQANVSEKIITIPETRAFNRPTLRNLKELYRKTVYGDDYERYKELSNNIQKKIDQLYTTQAGAFTKRGMRNKAKLLLALRKEEKSIKDGIEDTTLALPAGTLIPGKHYRVKTLKMLLAQAKDHTVYTGPYSSLIRKNLGLAPQEELSLIHVNRYIKEHIARQKLMIIKDMRQAQM